MIYSIMVKALIERDRKFQIVQVKCSSKWTLPQNVENEIGKTKKCVESNS